MLCFKRRIGQLGMPPCFAAMLTHVSPLRFNPPRGGTFKTAVFEIDRRCWNFGSDGTVVFSKKRHFKHFQAKPTDCLGFLGVEKSLGETEWIVLGCIVLEVLCWVREATETVQECSQCQNSGWDSKRGHASFQTAQTLGFVWCCWALSLLAWMQKGR
ncbi:MAG: uncharacterized protein A8A55_2701 [Amphiamblys sp. WSBS2006]|nr:MAG: uncharacterized protein A8A55_2701 [Amphiamblys sp. WSBS2006]